MHCSRRKSRPQAAARAPRRERLAEAGDVLEQDVGRRRGCSRTPARAAPASPTTTGADRVEDVTAAGGRRRRSGAAGSSASWWCRSRVPLGRGFQGLEGGGREDAREGGEGRSRTPLAHQDGDHCRRQDGLDRRPVARVVEVESVGVVHRRWRATARTRASVRSGTPPWARSDHGVSDSSRRAPGSERTGEARAGQRDVLTDGAPRQAHRGDDAADGEATARHRRRKNHVSAAATTASTRTRDGCGRGSRAARRGVGPTARVERSQRGFGRPATSASVAGAPRSAMRGLARRRVPSAVSSTSSCRRMRVVNSGRRLGSSAAGTRRPRADSCRPTQAADGASEGSRGPASTSSARPSRDAGAGADLGRGVDRHLDGEAGHVDRVRTRGTAPLPQEVEDHEHQERGDDHSRDDEDP